MSELHYYRPDKCDKTDFEPKWGNKIAEGYIETKPWNWMDVGSITLKPGYWGPITTNQPIVSDGGPSLHYDLPEGTYTLNDIIENRSLNWLQYSFHLSNVFKACFRWGTKSGTTIEYDARKIIYSGCRLLKMIVSTDALRKELRRLLDDPQFAELHQRNLNPKDRTHS